MAPPKRTRTAPEWARFAASKLNRVLKAAHAYPELMRLGPRASPWVATVRLVGSPEMTRLNIKYRKKAYPTDVLSFSSPQVFRSQGHLGELVICLPTCKKQARALKHSVELELGILLVHGLLHLLGLDHEQSPVAAKKMAAWECRLGGASPGLIARTRSCI